MVHLEIKKELNNTAYVLDENSVFLNSDYRIMTGQEKCLAKCLKVMQNGRLKLIYFNEALRPLSEIYGCMNFFALMQVIRNLFEAILTVQNNGFLKVDNINEALDCIYINSKSLEVKLHYLPLKLERQEADLLHMTIRNQLVQLISSAPMFTGTDVQQICVWMRDEALSLESISKNIDILSQSHREKPLVYDEGVNNDGTRQLAANLRLSSQELQQEFHIHKPVFVIGKSKEKADGIISKSTVSREHCAIYFTDNTYYVEDLDSTNGTKVNGERIPRRQRVALANGDLISVADFEFSVEF